MKLLIKDKIRLYDLESGKLFMTQDSKCIALKTEYMDDSGAITAYIVGSGEKFWGGTNTVKDQWNLEVLEIEIVQEDHVDNPKQHIEPDLRGAFYTGFNRGIYVASVIKGTPIDGEYPTYEQYIENKNNLNK